MLCSRSAPTLSSSTFHIHSRPLVIQVHSSHLLPLSSVHLPLPLPLLPFAASEFCPSSSSSPNAQVSSAYGGMVMSHRRGQCYIRECKRVCVRLCVCVCVCAKHKAMIGNANIILVMIGNAQLSVITCGLGERGGAGWSRQTAGSSPPSLPSVKRADTISIRGAAPPHSYSSFQS